jgi:DHA2 family multidrug resistance protein
MLAWSMWEMATWTPDISQWTIIMTIMVQGAGLGFAFLPLQVLAFATLPPQYRTDGASLFSLFRNSGSAVGVSVTSSLLAHNTQVLHEQIGASITPFNRALQGGGVISRTWNPMHPHGAALMDQLVNRRAQITAYIDDYWMMIFTTLPALALLFLLSRPKPSSPAAGKAHAAID